MSKSNKQNRGTGAGGSNTNKNGKKFEDDISISSYLLENEFTKKMLTKKNYYLECQHNDLSIKHMLQNSFRYYMKNKHNKKVIRVPDEIFILERGDEKPILMIVEIKNQNVEGSVETKLWACDGLKYEYEYLYEDIFDVKYCVVVSNFLKNKFEDISSKKYQILKKYYEKRKINLFYGEDTRYHNKMINYLINFFMD